MIVRENIDFRRKIDPKESLDLGLWREIDEVHLEAFNTSPPRDDFGHSNYTLGWYSLKKEILSGYPGEDLTDKLKKYRDSLLASVVRSIWVNDKEVKIAPDVIHIEFIDKEGDFVDDERTDAILKKID